MGLTSANKAASIPIMPSIWRIFLPPTAISLVCLYVGYITNFLVFHTLSELITVCIGLTVMTVALTTKSFTKNQFIVFISLAAGFYSCFDIAHILSYKGMNLLPQGGGNLSTQLWISARLFQAMSFLGAIFFLRRPLNLGRIILFFTLITLGLFIIIFEGYFPTTYTDIHGVTLFKMYCELVIIIILVMALIFLWHERSMLHRLVLLYMMVSIVLLILSDAVLASYKNLYSYENVMGHIFKIYSYWFIYQALAVQTLRRPFVMLARAASTYDNIPYPTMIIQSNAKISQANYAASVATGLDLDKIVGVSSHTLFHNKRVSVDACPVCSQLTKKQDHFIVEMNVAKRRWVECSLAPIHSDAFPDSWVHIVHDITHRKTLEAQRAELTHNLALRVKELKCLSSIASLIVLDEPGIETLLAKVVEILPSAFQYPERMVVLLESPWGTFCSNEQAIASSVLIEKEIKINHSAVVRLVVSYCEGLQGVGTQFLSEEIALLDSLALLLQTVVSQKYAELNAIEAEHRLKESEQRFQSFVAQTHVGVYIRNEDNL